MLWIMLQLWYNILIIVTTEMAPKSQSISPHPPSLYWALQWFWHHTGGTHRLGAPEAQARVPWPMLCSAEGGRGPREGPPRSNTRQPGPHATKRFLMKPSWNTAPQTLNVLKINRINASPVDLHGESQWEQTQTLVLKLLPRASSNDFRG